MQTFTFTLYGEVSDAKALYRAAMKRAISCGMERAYAEQMLSDVDNPKQPNISACVRILFDVSHDGIEITDSECEETEWTA